MTLRVQRYNLYSHTTTTIRFSRSQLRSFLQVSVQIFYVLRIRFEFNYNFHDECIKYYHITKKNRNLFFLSELLRQMAVAHFLKTRTVVRFAALIRTKRKAQITHWALIMTEKQNLSEFIAGVAYKVHLVLFSRGPISSFT